MFRKNEERPSAPPTSRELDGDRDTGSFDLLGSDIARYLGRYVPAQWVGVSGYLVAGVFVGLVLILALSIGKVEPAPSANGGVVTDNVTRLHARDVGAACWTGVGREEARLTVSMEVGVDGKVRSAVAAGESPTMRSCVESVVRSWEFLPQAAPQAMVLPFAVDRR